MVVAISMDDIPIRLTDERWQHITTGHPEMADFYYDILETIEDPEIIYKGNDGAKIALKKATESFSKFVVVVYKELEKDGFVITAYISNKPQRFKNKKILWKQRS
jgi:hypothetical protein